MSIKLKDYRYSYVFLLVTIILFSRSFLTHENPLLYTLSFLFIVNLACFSNEYLVIKYYKNNEHKDPNKGYALLVMFQVLFTLILFAAFKMFA